MDMSVQESESHGKKERKNNRRNKLKRRTSFTKENIFISTKKYL
jgi:hypothetical protein